jgi:hypothetical protein
MSSRNAPAFAATAIAAPPPLETREHGRRQMLWSGVLQTARGPCPCLVVDLSGGGARVSGVVAVEIGQSVTLVVSGMGLYRGTVVWRESGSLGISFAGHRSQAVA